MPRCPRVTLSVEFRFYKQCKDFASSFYVRALDTNYQYLKNDLLTNKRSLIPSLYGVEHWVKLLNTYSSPFASGGFSTSGGFKIVLQWKTKNWHETEGGGQK